MSEFVHIEYRAGSDEKWHLRHKPIRMHQGWRLPIWLFEECACDYEDYGGWDGVDCPILFVIRDRSTQQDLDSRLIKSDGDGHYYVLPEPPK